VLFAIIGAGIGALLSRGRHPAPVIVGLIFGAMVGLAPLTLARQLFADLAKRPGWFGRIGRLIDALRDGDLVIWTATGVFLLIVLVIGGVWAKTAFEFRREEERNRRRGRGRTDAASSQPAGRVPSSALKATSEKAVAVEVARLRWLLWTSIGLAVAAVGLYWNLTESKVLESILAALSLFAAAASLFTCVWWLLSKRLLLIGESRVFLISLRTKRLVGHIPFDQVESVHFHHGEEGDLLYQPGVTIRVRKDRGPETFWPWLLPQETDVIIPDRFVRAPDVLRQMLRTHWREYVRKREREESPPGGFSSDVDMVG
jgi:hypothetical protein